MATSSPAAFLTAVRSRNRPTHSCTRCANRKVKCDRQSPCSSCVKHHVECVFNPSHSLPLRKRQKRAPDLILTDRLRYYEALLQDHGIDPSKLPATPASEDSELQTPLAHRSDPSVLINKTQVIHNQGRFKFVDNPLWTRVVEELHDPEDALHDSSDEASDQEESDGGLELVLHGQSKSSNKPINHPPPEQIQQLWRIFTENVDPLTKVVHVPTLQPAIQKAASNIKAVPRSFQPLMFAIYSLAVMTLTDDECQETFGESRKILLSRYILATKATLSRAKFMGTTSLVVLQALVLHLLAVRDVYEPRTVWTLTGVAVRIAEGMGLERDGTLLGLPPFEIEIRRRVWFQLKTHDYRAAELCGLAKFRDLDTSPETTQRPSNANDTQLYPGMPALLTDCNSLTDAVFICLRYELTSFAAERIAKLRRQGKGPSKYHLLAFGDENIEVSNKINEVEALIETKYLRFCDPSQPLQLMTMITARFALNVARFMSHHPRRWDGTGQASPAERKWVWEISIKLLEQHNTIQMSSQLKQFAWHAPYYLQWHAFIHVLDTLRSNRVIAEAEKLWNLIENTYENTPAMIFDTKKPIHVAVGNLCLKAYSAREASLTDQGQLAHLPPTPAFILQLHQQRELALAARQSKQSKLAASRHHEPPQVADLSSAMETTNLQWQEPSPPQSETDSFWHLHGFGDDNEGMSAAAVSANVDLMLAFPRDQSMQDVDNAITWEQWDAWLADSNLIRPQQRV